MLGLLSDAFRLYPISGIEPPEPAQKGAFLMEYPQYVNGGYFEAAAYNFANDPTSFDGLSPERQQLAASLIAVTFSEQQLQKIAKI